ncbi:MAG: TetR family transcriptional regulator [Nitrospirae bacterium]|nr:TetR family transcriptional regulator [Nitrospirota bacterium]
MTDKSGQVADSVEIEGGETHALTPVSFALYLDNRANSPELPKRERTRNRFKAGAARILETRGYHGLKMSVVCQELGLSQGSIYNYFSDRKELALYVMSEFADHQFGVLLNVHPRGDAYARVYQVNLAYVRFISHNTGLFRCLRQLCDELPEFRELWHRKNYGWCVLVARDLQNRTGSKDMAAAMALARALGAMIDEVLHEIYVRRNPELASLAESPETLAETLSAYWYRMAFAANPEISVLREDHPILEFQLAEEDKS